jgi:hypothetical protein
MAFIGMVFVGIALAIFCVICFLMIVFFTLAIIFKTIGKKKDSRKLRITGNVFLGLGIVFSIPIILVIVGIIFNRYFEKVDMPDGSTRVVLSSTIKKMNALCEDGSNEAVEALSKLLDHHQALVYYYDVNYKSVLDQGLLSGNVGIVKTALEHGAVLDDPNKYDHMAYDHSSMELFITSRRSQTITAGDVEVLKLLFEKGAATSCDRCRSSCYSNYLGEAAWMVLYNDGIVTDTEMDFMQVFIDNGITSDSGFRLYGESGIYDSWVHSDVVMDENYDALLDMVGE